jgi:hypothetical protein
MTTSRTAHPAQATGVTLRRAALVMATLCLVALCAWASSASASPTAQPGFSQQDCAPTRSVVERREGSRGLSIEPPPLRLVALAYYDLHDKNVLYAPATDGAHSWPGTYDLIPMSGVRTRWEPAGLPSRDVAKLIASDCYSTTVELNGVPLGTFNQPNGPGKRFFLGDSTYVGPCPQAKSCLYLTITQAAWAAAKAPWVLDIRVTKVTRHQASPTEAPTIDKYGDVVPSPRFDYRALPRSRGRVLANPQSSGSYFATRIYPTFQHGRCQSCHALGSVEALASRHAAVGPQFDGYSVVSTSTPTGAVITCSGGCHVVGSVVPNETFDESEWKAPAFARDIDWRQKSAAAICGRVRANLPTEAKARHHFYEDARIAWAVHSGITPYGQQLGRAPPGSFAAWKELLEPWLRGTMPCP